MVMAVEVETEPIPSVKDLASSEPSLRRKGLQQIITHLESRSLSNRLTHNQSLQLWRAFHVALYMHDSKNQLSVQTLIATLANTFKIIRSKDIEFAARSTDSNENKDGESNGHKAKASTEEAEFTGFDEESPIPPEAQPDNSWLSIHSTAFWETMAREWSGVDQWRMNKFLLLIRFALRELFNISLSSRLGVETPTPSTEKISAQEDDVNPTPKTKKRKGPDSEKSDAPQSKKAKKSKPSSQPQPKSVQNQDSSTAKSQLSILTLWPLSPRERKVSDGLRLHILDIYLDELFDTFDKLKTAHASEIEELGDETVKAILGGEFLEPVRGIAKDGLARHVRVRAKEVLGEVEGRLAAL